MYLQVNIERTFPDIREQENIERGVQYPFNIRAIMHLWIAQVLV
jgi:hypothetical protein